MIILRAPLLIGLSLALPLVATGQAQSTPEAAKSPLTTQRTPIYKPPLRGAPVTRVGGASRGLSNNDLVLSVLAPESTGLTTRAQPTLYWYSSKGLTAPLEFTLNDDHSIKPLVELKVPATQSGIHALRLPYTLKPEVEYQWTIAAVTDPNQRASDILASGTIKRVQPSPVLSAQLNQIAQREQPFLYAQEGFWYDALAALSEQIAANPLNHSLREQRAALLEQVGLSAAAIPDRMSSKAIAAQ
ncbi:MAG TPA: DUF928 domain-containing protein [Candidatus Competibacteraceae bacterium]|nr:DUF928 domain-containing protein [Candidatus Competibacteraceae bacterium]HRZ05261.1 DUF928 domain-containing protein [Candidatus Competibacteraceae bacterium]